MREHFGFIVAGKFQRGQHRGERRYVGSYERDRARALQLLVRGLDRVLTDPDRAAAGRYLLALAEAAMGDRAQTESWRLQTLTPLDVLPDYDENPYRYWGRQQTPAHPSSPTGRPSITGCPRASTRRRTTASAGGGRWPRPSSSTPITLNAARLAASRLPASASSAPRPWRSGVRRRTLRWPRRRLRPVCARHPLRRRDRSPGWPPASSGSSSPTSSTSSRSTRRSSTTRRWACREEALAALVSIFENRRQLDRAADYLEAESRDLRGQGRRQDAAHRPDPRRLGPVRTDADAARRPGRRGRLPLPQRPPRPLRGARGPLTTSS